MSSTIVSAAELGLSEADLEEIIQIMSVYKQVDQAYIFGSRAKGNYKPGSDVDLAVFGADLTFQITNKIHHMLEGGTYMPYFFDVVDATHLKHEALKAHIKRVGKLIYIRTSIA